MYFIYVLLSEKYAKTYVGITDNIGRRLMEHNSGYTVFSKRYMPWKIIYNEKVETRRDARKREKYFKSAAGCRWMSKSLFNNK